MKIITISCCDSLAKNLNSSKSSKKFKPSLTKNLNQVKDLLISFGKIPDIIAISETKLRDGGFHNVSLEGFDFVHHNSLTNARDVGLYIKQGINFNLITKPNLNIEGCEDIWIDVKMDNNKKVVIGAIYRHPKSNFIDFQTSFVNTIELLNALSATYYIAGDINIDLSKSDKNANVADYVNTLHSMVCSQVIASPTRITANFSSLLDHIYTNNHNQHILSHALYSNISDHLPVLIMSKNFKLLKLQYRCYKRDCSGFIEYNFLLEMSEFCNGFLNVSDSISADELFNQFISQIKSIINKHAPLKQMSRKELKLRRKPWITTDIIRTSKRTKIYYSKICLEIRPLTILTSTKKAETF